MDGQSLAWMLCGLVFIVAFVYFGTESAAREYVPPCSECGRRSALFYRVTAYCWPCWRRVKPGLCVQCSEQAVVTLIDGRQPLCDWHWEYARALMRRADYEREMREADRRAFFERRA